MELAHISPQNRYSSPNTCLLCNDIIAMIHNYINNLFNLYNRRTLSQSWHLSQKLKSRNRASWLGNECICSKNSISYSFKHIPENSFKKPTTTLHTNRYMFFECLDDIFIFYTLIKPIELSKQQAVNFDENMKPRVYLTRPDVAEIGIDLIKDEWV